MSNSWLDILVFRVAVTLLTAGIPDILLEIVTYSPLIV